MPTPLLPPKSQEEILKDRLHQARRDYELPESIQIARVNGKLLRGEIAQHEASRQIFSIRARFEGDVNKIMEIR